MRKRCCAPPEIWQTKQNHTSTTIYKQNTTKNERKGQENRSSTKAPSRQPQQLWYEQHRNVLPITQSVWYPATLYTVSFLLSSTAVSVRPLPPLLPIPLDATHNGSAALPTQFHLIVMHPKITNTRRRAKQRVSSSCRILVIILHFVLRLFLFFFAHVIYSRVLFFFTL